MDKEKAQLDEDWPVTLLIWQIEQGEFILIPFLGEKSLICGYVMKSSGRTSKLQLLKVVQGCLVAKVGHLEWKKGKNVSFVYIS
jgi:hypothetical protein